VPGTTVITGGVQTGICHQPSTMFFWSDGAKHQNSATSQGLQRADSTAMFRGQLCTFCIKAAAVIDIAHIFFLTY